VTAIGGHAAVLTTGEIVELLHALFSDGGYVIEKVRTLRGDALHVSVLVLDGADHDRVVDGPELGDAAAGGSVDHALCGGGRIDDVFGPAEILGDEFALGQHQGF